MQFSLEYRNITSPTRLSTPLQVVQKIKEQNIKQKYRSGITVAKKSIVLPTKRRKKIIQDHLNISTISHSIYYLYTKKWCVNCKHHCSFLKHVENNLIKSISVFFLLVIVIQRHRPITPYLLC